jgi:taurine dioxygenase
MTVIARTDLEVRPLTGALGAEVLGVDLTRIDDAAWAQIHELWLEHLVLFFPGQQLAPDDHVALGRRLGEAEIHPFIPKLDDAHPEIIVLDSDAGVRADIWHTDVTFTARPPLASILHMAVCPTVGGDTLFSNQYLALEGLSDPLRDLLGGLTAVHTAKAYGHPEINATHPVVRIHPETGRASLFVNRSFTSHLVEMSGTESEALLELLFRWSEQPQFQCRYRWTQGAVGIWDNRCTQHHAINDYTARRVIQRVTVLGDDEPAGGAPRWQPWKNATLSASEMFRQRTPSNASPTDGRTKSLG